MSLLRSERADDEPRGNALGEHARERHAVGRHAEADDEHEVEDNIQHACGGEVDERRFRVADGAQNAAAVVVERGGGHAEEVNAQVELGAVDEVLARVEKLKERTGEDKTRARASKSLRSGTRGTTCGRTRAHSFSLRAPKCVATSTLAPLPRPIRKPVNRKMSVVVEPTEPMAAELEKRPTTARSTMLKSICKRLVNISGREKPMI